MHKIYIHSTHLDFAPLHPQLAKTHLDSLNKLLEAYGKIASSIPGLKQYRNAFESHPPLRKVLEDYYSDILNFHTRALEVFGRSSMLLQNPFPFMTLTQL